MAGSMKVYILLLILWKYHLSTHSQQNLTYQCSRSDIKANTNCQVTKDSVLRCKLGGSSSNNINCSIHRDDVCNDTFALNPAYKCDVGCSNYYRCDNGDCVERITVCDGNPCDGCREDDEWKNGPGFYCVRQGEYCKLPQQLLWDSVKDCDQGEDLCYSDLRGQEDGRDIRDLKNITFDESRCFQCLDNSMIIPRDKVCDDVIDCSDLSDECLCEGKVPTICNDVVLKSFPQKTTKGNCSVGEVECGDSTCIPRRYVCDSVVDCPNNTDEGFDYCGGTLLCKDGLLQKEGEKCRCVASCQSLEGNVCDGIPDCPPPTGKNSKWINPPGYPADECYVSCTRKTFNCTNPSYNEVGSALYRDRCKINENETTVVSSLNFCDGKLDCPGDWLDERNCPERFRCPFGDLVSISRSRMCDGFVDCEDGSDESNVTCPDRFFCPSLGGKKISIRKSLVCDFHINCDDASDEMGCGRRFYCENLKPLFVKLSQTFDGYEDCSDISDECPTKTEYKNENVFSSRYELIANPFFRALVWIMGLLAIVGNTIVIAGEVKALIGLFKADSSATTRANHMLILNLAVADILMGIYLLILGIAGLVFSGDFCLHKLKWLSGRTCTAMGVLVMLSSECSVVTMVLLTSVRLYAVLKPFSANHAPKISSVLVMIAFSWAFSFLFALLPLSSYLENMFVDRAIIPNKLFFKNVEVSIDEAKNVSLKLLTYDPAYFTSTNQTIIKIRKALTWEELRASLSEGDAAKYLDTSGFIGYYSANSVCIPRIFVTKGEDGWEFSLTFTIFNFMAFLYVAITYCVVYIRANKSFIQHQNVSNQAKQDKKKLKMQKKILRLIVTDFCCWVPISIMAFINFSGVNVPDEAYVISAIVLLPINSALNPILYSNFIDALFEKICKSKKKSAATSGSSQSSRGTNYTSSIKSTSA